MQILPSRSEITSAAPGIVIVVLPIIVVSELIYWIESYYVRAVFGIPAPIIALMIAAVIAIVSTNLFDLPKKYLSGLSFSTRWLLRTGIVLYGLNFSYSLWIKPGAQWILVIGVVSVIVPLIAAYYLGKIFHLGEKLSLLVAVGTGICGISAIVATQQAIKSDEESAGMALATILTFGTMVLFLYPVLDGIFSLDKTIYGIWTGGTTLDLPQLVAAALQGGGSSSLLMALWVKSIRIGLLVPVILVLILRLGKSATASDNAANSKYARVLSSFPLFIVGFFLVILLNTFIAFPSWIISPIATGNGEFLGLNAANLFLTAAIIGICFRVRRNVIGRTGWKILTVGGLAWCLQSLIIFLLANILPIPQA